jgi:XTP/dITP diphosphohydrolase
MVRLVVATTNRNKVREIRSLLAGLDIELSTLDRWPDLASPDETGGTFEENARQKATYYARGTSELVVAEDSGLEIDALGGAPGVESARYGGTSATYPQKFALIYQKLRGVPDASRVARFVCALALVRGDELLFATRGTIEGEIAAAPRGSGGFGYDPIFFYPPLGRTLGEATAEEKAAVSHRAQAFRRLRQYLGEQGSCI